MRKYFSSQSSAERHLEAEGYQRNVGYSSRWGWVKAGVDQQMLDEVDEGTPTADVRYNAEGYFIRYGYL